MIEAAWKLLAFVVSRPVVANAIVERAKRTPYRHLPGFMRRDWFFNPYEFNEATGRYDRTYEWLPSIRVHHILRPDKADHPHDHPWDGRTIILRGWYRERRVGKPPRVLRAGDTAVIGAGDFHSIEEISPDVCTLFFTWHSYGDWGFLVDGVKVPFREYFAEHADLKPY